jgi:hypothetical protein
VWDSANGSKLFHVRAERDQQCPFLFVFGRIGSTKKNLLQGVQRVFLERCTEITIF